MESTAPENWRLDEGVKIATQHQNKSDTPKESWNSERPGSGNGRRMSDGAPVPFNRTRSFKTKQLVRSQAIRESQSPPRVPSPRPPGKVELMDKNKMPSVKKKSLSMDSDDRNTSEDLNVDLCVDRQPIILKKSNFQKTTDNTNYTVNSKETMSDIVGATSKVESIYDSDDKVNTSQKILINKNDDENTTNNKDEIKITNNSTINNIKRNNINNNNNLDNIKKSNEMGITNKDCCDISKSNPKAECSNSTIVDTSTTANSLHSTANHYSTHKNNNNCLNIIKPNQGHHNVATENKKLNKINLAEIKKQSSFNRSQDNDDGHITRSESPVNRGNCTKVEFQQVEIQVTSGDYDTNLHERDTFIYPLKGNKRCDCMSFDEEKEKDKNADTNNWRGKRATCPSKQDSGICCWEQCQCCGDLSPDANVSLDVEDDIMRSRRQRQHLIEHDVHHQSIDNCRCQEKLERWPHRRSGSTLTVQRASSGGNPRLLRKQSSGGSVDSGQHSIASPYLSRDNSTELMTNNFESIDLNRFVKETLNKSYKDRINLLKIEHELISLVKDSNRHEHRFPQSSSYGRLLIHRCAELFGLKHGVDAAKQHVYVAKPSMGNPQCKIPSICPFQQWCFEKFLTSPTAFCADQLPPAKSILKRDAHSLDEEGATLQALRPTLRSKSFEQREEEYSKARQRIFNSTEQEENWEWEERKRNESDMENCKPQLLLPENDRTSRTARLTKVQSLETQETVRIVRGVVSKAHSFGGYGDRPNVTRQDSCISTHSAPPTRILSHKGELASSNWRLSPGNSSGYRTLSARSDSITPSPTPNCGDSIPTSGVLWAITDISSVPVGAVIIQPQTGQPLTNSDGTLYHYDPAHPPNTNLLNTTHLSTEGIRVLTNPERRRSRLEKQNATLSPNTEADLINEKSKLNENVENSSSNTLDVPEEINTNLKEEINYTENKENELNNHVCHCQECENININTNNVDLNNETTEGGNNVENNENQTNTNENTQVDERNNGNMENNENIQNNNMNIMGTDVTHINETNNINIEASKMLEQVVAAEYYLPNENYIYGSGYENIPEITADPNILDQTLQLENATELQPCDSSAINKNIKQDYCDENREMERRQEGEYGIILSPYQSVDVQGYYDPSIHQIGPYSNTASFDEQNTEIQPYPGCCGPIILRGPTGNMYPPQPYVLPLPMPSPYVPVSASTMLPPPAAPPPQPPPPPSQAHMYHGWGWPTMMYTPQPSISHPTVGEIPKVPTHGTYMPQAGDGNMQPNSNIPQTFYPHGQTATVLMTQPPPPCFPYSQQSTGLIPIPHSQQPMYHTYPVYQYPMQGRNSVLSIDGSPTPGFNSYDNQNASQQFTKVQEDAQKVWNNSKSPKAVLSREPSHSGSSRTTPLMNVQQITVGGVPYEGYPSVEQNLVNTMHYFTHPTYGIQQYARHNVQVNNEQIITNNTNNYYAKKHSVVNNNNNNNSSNNIASNDNKTDQTDNGIETASKMNHTKSFETYSNDNKGVNNEKIIDRRKPFRNSASVSNTFVCQESFEQGTYKNAIIVDKQNTLLTADGHFPMLNSKFNKALKPSQSVDNEINNIVCDNSDNSKYTVENSSNNDNNKSINNQIQDIKTSIQDAVISPTVKDLSDLTKIKSAIDEAQNGELSKQAIRENNVKSYLNFPKPRHNNVYKPNHYRNYEKDDREPRKYFSKDHTIPSAIQGTQSAWVLTNPESPLQYTKMSTTTPSSPAPSNVNISTKPYGEKLNNPQQTPMTKHFNKNFTKKEHIKEPFTAPNSGTAPTNQDIIQTVQQQLSSTTPSTTNNAFNKSLPRVNKTPPTLANNSNYNNHRNVIHNAPVGVDQSGVVRTQLIQTLGGVSLLQTPPQSGFYLRQIPGWLRRPPGHSIFGSPPPIVPHIRAPRPPRPFQNNNINYRQR